MSKRWSSPFPSARAARVAELRIKSGLATVRTHISGCSIFRRKTGRATRRLFNISTLAKARRGSSTSPRPRGARSDAPLAARSDRDGELTPAIRKEQP